MEAHCQVWVGRCAIGTAAHEVICFNLPQEACGSCDWWGTQPTASLVINAWRLFYPSGTTHWSRLPLKNRAERRWTGRESPEVLLRLCFGITKLEVELVLVGRSRIAMIFHFHLHRGLRCPLTVPVTACTRANNRYHSFPMAMTNLCVKTLCAWPVARAACILAVLLGLLNQKGLWLIHALVG
jgi:hypothetical protein